MPSYYCPQLHVESSSLKLEGEEFHHLNRVKRKQSGDLISLNSGHGVMALASIERIERDHAELEVRQIYSREMSGPQYAIALALLKNHHDELAIEKCTELGARDFFPLITQYSVRSEGKNTLARFRKIALSAIKQCDNPYLPEVHEILDLDTAIEKIRNAGYQPVLCSEIERSHWLRDLGAGVNMCFIIGPEGGFTENEFAFMQDIPQLMLSPLVCRAETAAIAVAAQFVGKYSGLQQNSL